MMPRTVILAALLMAAPLARGEEVVLEDRFENGLRDHWRLVGLDQQDVRVRNGALELRVQPGEFTGRTGMLLVDLPAGDLDGVKASVEVTPIEPFTKSGEAAGLCLNDATGSSFTVRKTYLDRKMLYAPPQYIWTGKGLEEGANPEDYDVRYGQVGAHPGPLVIRVRGGYAYFQVGRSDGYPWRSYFHSAVRNGDQDNSFGLFATGAPTDGEHWVRFDNLRIVRN